jgi:hypothetical protein
MNGGGGDGCRRRCRLQTAVPAADGGAGLGGCVCADARATLTVLAALASRHAYGGRRSVCRSFPCMSGRVLRSRARGLQRFGVLWWRRRAAAGRQLRRRVPCVRSCGRRAAGGARCRRWRERAWLASGPRLRWRRCWLAQMRVCGWAVSNVCGWWLACAGQWVMPPSPPPSRPPPPPSPPPPPPWPLPLFLPPPTGGTVAVGGGGPWRRRAVVAGLLRSAVRTGGCDDACAGRSTNERAVAARGAQQV